MSPYEAMLLLKVTLTYERNKVNKKPTLTITGNVATINT